MDVSGPSAGPPADPSPDADLDLSPRTGPGAGPTRPRARGRGLIVGLVIVALVGAMGYVLVRQVQGSSVYYYNVDEAVARRDQIGDQRIRIQGTVVGDPVTEPDDDVLFTVAFRGESVEVRHIGAEPPPLFEAGVPSVLEGRFADDGTFVSERIVIKHTEEYRDDNPDHVKESPALRGTQMTAPTTAPRRRAGTAR